MSAPQWKNFALLGFLTLHLFQCSHDTSKKKQTQSEQPRTLTAVLSQNETQVRTGDLFTCQLNETDAAEVRQSGEKLVFRVFNSKNLQQSRAWLEADPETLTATYRLRTYAETGSKEEADVAGDEMFCEAALNPPPELAGQPAGEEQNRSSKLIVANSLPEPAKDVQIEKSNAGGTPSLSCFATLPVRDADGSELKHVAHFFNVANVQEVFAQDVPLRENSQAAFTAVTPQMQGKEVSCAFTTSDEFESQLQSAVNSIVLNVVIQPNPVPTTEPTPVPVDPTPLPWPAPAAPELTPNSTFAGSIVMCRADFTNEAPGGQPLSKVEFRFLRLRAGQIQERAVTTYGSEELNLGLRYAFYKLKTINDVENVSENADVKGDRILCNVTLIQGEQETQSSNSKPITVRDTAPRISAGSGQNQNNRNAGEAISPIQLSVTDIDSDSLSHFVKKEDTCNMLNVPTADNMTIEGVMPDQDYPPLPKWCVGKFRAVAGGLESSNEVIVSFQLKNRAPKIACGSVIPRFTPGSQIEGFACSATDPDRNAKLSFSNNEGCSGISVDATTGQLKGVMPNATCVLKVTVSDGLLTSSSDLKFEVINP